MNALRARTWTDEQLKQAVSTSSSWRGVLRALGLRGTSASAIRIARRHATRLGLDVSHVGGNRRWSDDQLRQAVRESGTWDEVLTRLGLATNGGAPSHIKANAIRLGLDTGHLNRLSHLGRQPSEARAEISNRKAEMKYLRVAAPAVAAGWFALRGGAVSLPAEPTVYDLLVDTPDGIRRVQVKTTTHATKDGWAVSVGRHPDTHAKNRRERGWVAWAERRRGARGGGRAGGGRADGGRAGVGLTGRTLTAFVPRRDRGVQCRHG